MVTLDELKDKLASNARLIGLDLGTKRIGIAICDDKRKIASPYKTIEYKNMDYLVNELKNIIKDNNIFAVIIGNPINMDGSFGKSAQSINDKAKVIEKELDLIIAMWDERLSTSGAFNISSNLDINFSKKKKNIDEKAATLSPFFAVNSSSSLFSISFFRTYSPLGNTSPNPITSSDISLSNSILFSLRYFINSFSNISGSSTCSLNVSLSRNNAAAYVPIFDLSKGSFANIFLILKTNLCNTV